MATKVAVLFFVSRRGESNSRPLSYHESVLPLNYSGVGASGRI